MFEDENISIIISKKTEARKLLIELREALGYPASREKLRRFPLLHGVKQILEKEVIIL